MSPRLPTIEHVLDNLNSSSSDTKLDTLGLLAESDLDAYTPRERTRLAEALIESAGADLDVLGWDAFARVLSSLLLWVPEGAMLPERPDDLPTQLEVAWRELELALWPLRELDELTLEALARTNLARIYAPLEVLEALAHLDPLPAPILQRKLEEAVADAPIPGDQLAPMLLRWLDRSSGLARIAMRCLAKPWVCQSDDVRQSVHMLRRCIKSGDDTLARHAIEALSLLEDENSIALAIRDPDQTARGRALLFEHAGHLLPREALEQGFALALEDPWQYGDAMVACLEKMHARGVFLKPEQAPDVLDLFDRHQRFEPEQASRYLYVIRDAVYALLNRLELEDPRWFRLLELVPSLRDEHREALLSKLLSAPDPLYSHVCRVARASGTHCLEKNLLANLEKNADATLRALEACGGAQTADKLAALILEQDTPLWLRAASGRALSLIWHLGKDEYRQTLLSRLEPAALPARISDDLGPRMDQQTLELLMLSPQVGERPERALLDLCRHGGSEALEAIDVLLTRVLQSAVGDHVAGDPHQPWTARSETVLSAEVEEALDAYGVRLYSRGSLVIPTLARANSPSQAGRALRAYLLHEQIERAQDARVLRIALDALARTEAMENREQILALTRHEHQDVRKKAIFVLSAYRKDPGLIPRFTTLASMPDIQTARQAIEALGKLHDPGATPALIEALGHRNMNIKLSAAEALATSGDTRAIEPLLGWLERHDHERFRRLLYRALEAILEESLLPVLMTRLASANPRQLRLLSSAIQNLSIYTLRSRDALDDVAIAHLYEAVDLGHCQLVDATRQELLAWVGAGAYHRERTEREDELGGVFDETQLLPGEDNLLDIDAARVERHLTPLLDALPTARGEALAHMLRLLSKVRDFASLPREAHLSACKQLVNLLVVDPLFPRREELLELSTRFSRALPLSSKRALIDTIRAIEAFPGGDGEDRWRLLEASGALIEAQDILAIYRDCEVSHSPEIARRRASKLLFPKRSSSISASDRERLDVWRQREDFLDKDARDGLVTHMGGRRVLSYLLECLERDEGVLDDMLEHIVALAHFGSTSWRSHRSSRTRSENSEPWKPSKSWRLGRLKASREHEDADVRAASAMALLESSAPLARDEVEVLLEGYLGEGYELSTVGRRALAQLLEQSSPHLLARRWTSEHIPGWLDLLEHASLQVISHRAPDLLEIWRGEDTSSAERARRLLGKLDGDIVFALVYPAIKRGELGVLGLLSRSITEDAHVRAIIAQLEDLGEKRLARRLLGQLREGHLLDPDVRASRERDLATLLIPPSPLPPEARVLEQGEDGLLAALYSEDRYEVRAALRRVARFAGATQIEDRVVTLALEHEDLSLRSAAHRALRQISSRQVYLDVTRRFLHDPRRDVVRQAIRILAHGGSTQEIDTFVELLFGKDSMLAGQAREGLLILGDVALPELRRVCSRARPDRRPVIQEIIEQIQTSTLA